MSLAQPALSTVDYARPAEHESLPLSVRAAQGMVWLSVLSGFCIAVCFVAFTGVGGAVLHLALFASTISLAVWTGAALRPLGTTTLRTWFDGTALVGLAIMAVIPIVVISGQAIGMKIDDFEAIGPIVIAFAFATQAMTTFRHWLLYKQLGEICRAEMRQGLKRSLFTLGVFKMIYEALWLGCCTLAPLLLASQTAGLFSGRPMGVSTSDAAIFFGLGAFFGCFGFIIIWVWMIIVHSLLVGFAKRPMAGRGFEIDVVRN